MWWLLVYSFRLVWRCEDLNCLTITIITISANKLFSQKAIMGDTGLTASQRNAERRHHKAYYLTLSWGRDIVSCLHYFLPT